MGLAKWAIGTQKSHKEMDFMFKNESEVDICTLQLENAEWVIQNDGLLKSGGQLLAVSEGRWAEWSE